MVWGMRRIRLPARWEWPLDRLAAALALFGSIPAALYAVYLVGGLGLFASQPSWGGGTPLVAAFIAALAFGERVWASAFQRQVVAAALVSAFVAVACLYAGGYLLPLVTDLRIFQGSTALAIPLGLAVYLVVCLLAAAESDVEDARRFWMAAGVAGSVAFYVALLASA
jgi:hypothetical protein